MIQAKNYGDISFFIEMASNSPEYINQLRNLNDRLAALIDRVRSEGNNENRLESLIIIEKENAERALMKLKDDYERQLARNCTLLTETAKENAKYQFDIQKLSTEVEELTKK